MLKGYLRILILMFEENFCKVGIEGYIFSRREFILNLKLIFELNVKS